MKRVIRYLSHPQVEIDPQKEVTQWSLNEVGRRRVETLAESGSLKGTRIVISSAETKAVETARPIANALGCPLEIREKMHENDRSSTGFLPPEEFETVANQFFAAPETSVRGWEPATAAQSRIVAEVQACLQQHPKGDILFVGHGGVGTLLFCHLCGISISREYDQGAGGGGCFFEFTSAQDKPKTHWQPLENLIV